MGRSRNTDAEHPETKLSDGKSAKIVPSKYTSGYELDVNGTPQSHVDLADPSHLHFEYIARMGAVIDLIAEPGTAISAIHLGAGAMTVPRYIAHTRPGSRQQVIEIEAGIIQLVKTELPLPANSAIRTRIGDAREKLKQLPPALRGNCDLVISDVFSGAQTPKHLSSVEYYREIKNQLANTGTLLANLADGPALKFVRGQTATAKSIFENVILLAEPQIFKGRRFGNVVLAASDTPWELKQLQRLCAAGPHPAKVMHGEEIERFISGYPVTTDQNAQDSPNPDHTVFKR